MPQTNSENRKIYHTKAQENSLYVTPKKFKPWHLADTSGEAVLLRKGPNFAPPPAQFLKAGTAREGFWVTTTMKEKVHKEKSSLQISLFQIVYGFNRSKPAF